MQSAVMYVAMILPAMCQRLRPRASARCGSVRGPMRSIRTYARFVGLLVAGATACTPTIADKCVLSPDCSLQGERLCDPSQPGGYCTIFDCRANLCPDE